MIKITSIVTLSLSILLSACASTGSTPNLMMEKPTDAMMEVPTETMMEETSEQMMEKPTEVMIEETMDSMIEAVPDWFNTTLNNVHTSEEFTINDFKGKVVLVETLAIWCPSCKQQQIQIKMLNEMLEMNPDFVTIGLDVDPNENADDLKRYTESNGFDWIYAVAPADMVREIGNLYGDQFLNPPSTPILVIDRGGQVHPMPFGIKDSNDLMKFIEPFLIEEM